MDNILEENFEAEDTKELVSQIHKKVGRKRGQKATKEKFVIEFHNILENKWVELGRFPSLREASSKLNLSYGLLSDLNIGRRKIYNNFYRVKNLRKSEEEEVLYPIVAEAEHIPLEPPKLERGTSGYYKKDML